MNHTECRSCKAKIFWAKTINNQSIPIDAEPVEDGNMAVEEGLAVVVPKGERLPGTLFYKSHFVTCPQRNEWRKS